jgi:hypothetical protein
MSAIWFATNVNQWAETISDPDYLPFFYVISVRGVILERDDGEIRKFRKMETAQRAAEKLGRELRG